jgi:hypothetical protein
MKFRPLSIMLLGVVLMLSASSSVAAPVPQTPEPPDEMPALSGGSLEEYPFDLKGVVEQSAAGISLTGEQIPVALHDSYSETDPAVALCTWDQYLVVYIRDDNVYGQRLSSGGDLLGNAFLIYDGPHDASEPNVACEWTHNRFVVTWTIDYNNQNTDFDVYAQGVYGNHQTSGSQLHGSRITVSGGGQVERDAAVACNSIDYTCLVVLEDNSGGNAEIYGQRVSVELSGLSMDGTRFDISNFAAAEYNPGVAWGGLDDNYLVVWQYWYDDPDPGDPNHWKIVYSHVHDTDQGAGDELQHGGAYLMNPGEGWDRPQYLPVAAYNRDEKEYLVVLQYDYNGDGSDFDVVARRIYGTGVVASGNAFNVAASIYHESQPAVAFSGGPESLPGGMGDNQFLVTYCRDNPAVTLHGQAVKGAHDATGGQREGDAVSIFDNSPDEIKNPDVTGSINSGRYLVVWENLTGELAGTDHDVLGQMLSPGASVYLPLVLNGYASGFYFQPNPDGYSFPNYGNGSHYYQDDLGAGDLINMFGAGTVCASGSTLADCVLTAAAEAWRQQVFNWMNGGHCEGMAVTSLRFFKGQTYYTGDTTPGDFQAGAQTVYDLARSQAIDNYIAYYFALQDVEEVWQPTEFIRENYTPRQQLEMVRQELRDGNDPYTLNVYDADFTVGHAIVPYDVQDRGGGLYRLYVYDNNNPGDDNRYITFDTNNDTWYYTATFVGNADTKSLSLSRISLRTGEPFTCPFAVGGSAVEFFLTNGGDVLITNARGQRIGYDPATGQMVNEIPDAHVVYLRGVHGPKYWIPLGEAGEVYSVAVSGANISAQVETDLVMVGPGYVVGFEDIQLQPSQTLRVSMSADGRQLVFEEGQTAPSPQVFQAID